jgi:energy-coupling factor transporter ATP-binding protein EcfA2
MPYKGHLTEKELNKGANMNTKLILIEGLPGSGKTTIAKLVHELMKKQGLDAQLFLEGNLDHPADYESVAFFDKNEYGRLLEEYPEYQQMLKNNVVMKENGCFIPYVKMKEKYGKQISHQLFNEICTRDIYELSFKKNVELITERWNGFGKKALHSNSPYVFECCFMQNPLTIGLVKYNRSMEEVSDYVLGLAETIKSLNPLLIYVDQNNLETSFKRALDERPKAWSEGFIEYYTKQGYGENHKFYGVDGTIEVLEAMKLLEKKIYDNLDMKKIWLDNSQFNLGKTKLILKEKLEDIFK